MQLPWKKQDLTDHDEFHNYIADLADLTKLREKAMQKSVLQPSESANKEVERYDVMIEIAQKVVLRLSPID